MTRDLPLCLDLFCGTGSATALIREHGCMRVVGLDLSPKAKGRDVTADVRRLPLAEGARPRFVWASPPCTEFSHLTHLRVYHPGGKPPNPELGMELVRVAFARVEKADFWVVENVRGSEPWISREFGKPWLVKDAWCLWSNLPPSLLPESNVWRKCRAARYRHKRPLYQGPSRKFRGLIPRPLAEAVHDAVCPLGGGASARLALRARGGGGDVKRRGYVNDGLTEEGKRRLKEAARLGVCPRHWVPLPPRRQVWCGKGEPVGPQDNPATALVQSCYWAFHLDPRWSRARDWKALRDQVLARDGKRCVNCGAAATEVDHIAEIQDGGAEFDMSNLRSLCHRCHVRKTTARRRFGPGPSVERALRSRLIPLEVEA